MTAVAAIASEVTSNFDRRLPNLTLGFYGALLVH